MASAEYYRNRRALNKVRAIEFLGGQCANCGSVNGLQFDRILAKVNGGEKSRNVTTMLHYSWASIVRELKLCQLLCQTCHIAKSLSEMPADHWDSLKKHGIGSYFSGCRCKSCLSAYQAYNQRRRDMRAKKSGKVISSPSRGVRRLPSGRFQARTTISRKTVPLGTFDSLEEAKRAYLEFNRVNRPNFDTRLGYRTKVPGADIG